MIGNISYNTFQFWVSTWLFSSMLTFCKHSGYLFPKVLSPSGICYLILETVTNFIVTFIRHRKIWSFHDRWSLLEAKIFIVLKNRTFCPITLCFSPLLKFMRHFLTKNWSPRGRKKKYKYFYLAIKMVSIDKENIWGFSNLVSRPILSARSIINLCSTLKEHLQWCHLYILSF